MLLDRFTDRHGQPQLGIRSITLFTVEGTKLAEIVVQVAGGHTAKLLYLAIQITPLSLERQQEHRFVSLGNDSQCLRLDGFGCCQHDLRTQPNLLYLTKVEL